jgi:hypothetical protein
VLDYEGYDKFLEEFSNLTAKERSVEQMVIDGNKFRSDGDASKRVRKS